VFGRVHGGEAYDGGPHALDSTVPPAKSGWIAHTAVAELTFDLGVRAVQGGVNTRFRARSSPTSEQASPL
jgi:hypothetical protein